MSMQRMCADGLDNVITQERVDQSCGKGGEKCKKTLTLIQEGSKRAQLLFFYLSVYNITT